ncbi:hypothetical protein [Paracoccus sp. JM45]|uniref:hypothetical protein n=1 Tax=Paracoccus sp. JM45 TaxID=2283626 RepID=UPI000E6C08DA|nr:hypothetical protein [Paracoccus sp. JM45]RJE80096.1 hypothetical protein DWB67_07800 [Paracoccus sp. JM45]
MLKIFYLGAVLVAGPLYADAVNLESVRSGPTFVQGTTSTANVQDRIWQVLGLGRQMQIFQQEATDEAAAFAAEGMIAGSGEPWAETVARINQPARLQTLFRQGMGKVLMRSDLSLLNTALGFYETGLGRQLVPLEISARMAMLDDTVSENAQDAFRRAAARNDPRVDQINRLIEVADLVEPNVTSGLNASVAFSRGFGEGGGYDMPLSEGEMLSETWSQQDQIEADTRDWLQSFLMLAYSSLSDEQLDEYIAYAASPEGDALARALFAAYDEVFLQTSYDMGLAAALRLQGRQL